MDSSTIVKNILLYISDSGHPESCLCLFSLCPWWMQQLFLLGVKKRKKAIMFKDGYEKKDNPPKYRNNGDDKWKLR